jgi:uncharacterized membrane protein
MRLALAWVATAVVFLGMDATWISLTTATLYHPVLAPLLAANVRPLAAVAFYALYISGVLLLAVRPGLRAGRWTTAAGLGATLGLVAYGTYDLTNQATLKVWATHITLLDMGWGMVATATAASAGCLAGRKVGG